MPPRLFPNAWSSGSPSGPFFFRAGRRFVSPNYSPVYAEQTPIDLSLSIFFLPSGLTEACPKSHHGTKDETSRTRSSTARIPWEDRAMVRPFSESRGFRLSSSCDLSTGSRGDRSPEEGARFVSTADP